MIYPKITPFTLAAVAIASVVPSLAFVPPHTRIAAATISKTSHLYADYLSGLNHPSADEPHFAKDTLYPPSVGYNPDRGDAASNHGAPPPPNKGFRPDSDSVPSTKQFAQPVGNFARQQRELQPPPPPPPPPGASGQPQQQPPPPPPPPPVGSPPPVASTTATSTTPATSAVLGRGNDYLTHATVDFFAIDQMTPKGPREGADVGNPHDATRSLVKLVNSDASIAVGSWWCAAGGWPSPNKRTTTEVFYVLDGHGCLTDADDTKHYFGPGDTVILPKGWSGRWDVLADIHKVWFVHDHANIEVKENPIRAGVTHYKSLQHLYPQGVRPDAIYGTSPETAFRTDFDIGPTKMGYWTMTCGSVPVHDRPTTECFHVLEGEFILTNAIDGSAQRCKEGDTIILPQGWSGYWDVVEPVKKMWVVV